MYQTTFEQVVNAQINTSAISGFKVITEDNENTDIESKNLVEKTVTLSLANQAEYETKDLRYLLKCGDSKTIAPDTTNIDKTNITLNFVHEANETSC